LRDTQDYEHSIRALLGTASHFCEVLVLKLRTGGLDGSKCRVVPGWKFAGLMSGGGGRVRNFDFTEMCCGTEAGSYLRLVDSCITQLKAQGPSRTCHESKEEEEEEAP